MSCFRKSRTSNSNSMEMKPSFLSVLLHSSRKSSMAELPSASERKGRRKNDKMEVDYPKVARKWLENSSELQLDGLALQGIRLDRVERGVVRCDFVIPDHLSVTLLIDSAYPSLVKPLISAGNGSCDTPRDRKIGVGKIQIRYEKLNPVSESSISASFQLMEKS